MASNLQKASALLEQTALNVTKSPEAWTAFLNTAARIYKYPFTDQLLIYAQRPDATAVATYPIWNQRMHRWIRRGASGISLLDRSKDRPELKYVFDVSDTRPGKGAREPWLWQLREEHHAAVMKTLEESYGVTEEDMSQRLAAAAANAVESSLDIYVQDFLHSRNGSRLAEQSDENAVTILRHAARATVQHLVLARCSIRAQHLYDSEFGGVENFNTADAIMALGRVTQEISAFVLHQIERIIKTYERGKNRNGLENSEQKEYNTNRSQFSVVNRESEVEQHGTAKDM